MFYGIEVMYVMCVEKGFIMIGDEIDGMVILQDLGMFWVISKKKFDYIGKCVQECGFMVSFDCWKLVGLESVDGCMLFDGVYVVVEGKNVNGQCNVQGWVILIYVLLMLLRFIVMGLVKYGFDCMGEVLEFLVQGVESYKVWIVDLVFYDKEGSWVNG